MEFLPQSLYKLTRQGPLNMDLFRFFAIGIAEGVSYLHSQDPQIIHRFEYSVFHNNNNNMQRLEGFYYCYLYPTKIAQARKYSY